MACLKNGINRKLWRVIHESMKKELIAIIDIDGTLADSSGRAHFIEKKRRTKKDWIIWEQHTYEDKVIESVKALCYAIKAYGARIVFITARCETCRKATLAWFKANLPELADSEFVMRKKKDKRPDTIVKKELYESWIKPNYDILFAVDDKQSIADLYRKMGICVLHVGEGKAAKV